MSQNAAITSSSSGIAATRQQMERCVDQLAELARTDVEAGKFFSEVLSRLRQNGVIEQARLWRPSMDGSWEVIRQLPADLPTTIDSELVSWLTDGAKTQQISTRAITDRDNGNNRLAARTLGPIVHTGQTVGFLDAVHPAGPNGGLTSDVVPFLRAICEITADYLSQSELRQLRQAQSQWQRWDKFSEGLMQSPDLAGLAATIVNDGRLLAECDRVTLLRQNNTPFETLAVTGVEQIESRSNTVRSIEKLAKLVASGNQSLWFNLQEPAEAVETPHRAELSAHAGLTGAKAIGLIPLPSTPTTAAPLSNRAVLAVEQFQNVLDFPAWKLRAETLARRSEPLLLAAFERDGIPFLNTMQRLRRLPAWLRRPSFRLALLGALAAAGALTFVPGEFTVTGPAELVPDHRREVFASSSGIVEELLVQHGDDVNEDQPLVVLHDPQLALELPRIVGELDVVRERLKGVLSARLTGGSTPDSANRARLLASEEEELKERQQSLNRQRTLIEKQQAALTLRSPIRGKVLTWDVSTLLSARPVERGQALLTIGDTHGPWVIEMRIADKDFGHVRDAQKRLKRDLDVEFLLASDPSRSYRGTIRDVAATTSLDDQIGISVMVTVAIDSSQLSNPHAGTTAITRIHCGRQPIGYVWLHDLIDAIRTRLLF
jgi:multidrug efflux pump subunit AcrA (membrane-fusion protein)